jgi:tetratricopeptide (TPR) repeat protein
MFALTGCISKDGQYLREGDRDLQNHNYGSAKTEYQRAIQDNPKLIDAQRGLADVDEIDDDVSGAARQWAIVSQLDRSDTRAFAKACYYKHLHDLVYATNRAITEIKAGQVDEGVNALRDVLSETRQKVVFGKAIEAAREAGPIIFGEADELVRQRKYFDAISAYATGLRDYVMIAEASHAPKLDPAADQLMKSLGAAAKEGNTPNSPLRILNEIIAYDPDENVAKAGLARIYLARDPPNYSAAANLLEQAGASDGEVRALRARDRH